MPVLTRLLFHSDNDILTDASWALSYLSDGPNDKIQAVIDSGVSRRLVELLMSVSFMKPVKSEHNIKHHHRSNVGSYCSRHNSHSVVSAALRAVGNIVTGDDIQTQVILNSSALPCLFQLLSSTKESIRKEACWTISNITAGNRNQIQV